MNKWQLNNILKGNYRKDITMQTVGEVEKMESNEVKEAVLELITEIARNNINYDNLATGETEMKSNITNIGYKNNMEFIDKIEMLTDITRSLCTKLGLAIAINEDDEVSICEDYGEEEKETKAIVINSDFVMAFKYSNYDVRTMLVNVGEYFEENND